MPKLGTMPPFLISDKSWSVMPSGVNLVDNIVEFSLEQRANARELKEIARMSLDAGNPTIIWKHVGGSQEEAKEGLPTILPSLSFGRTMFVEQSGELHERQLVIFPLVRVEEIFGCSHGTAFVVKRMHISSWNGESHLLPVDLECASA